MKLDHAAFDREVLELLRTEQTAHAATRALRVYGPEIYALLASLHRQTADASEVFSVFCERLWKGLSGFEGRASFRTWIYTIAWHASSRFREQQRARPEVLISDSQFSALALEVRTQTQSRLGEEQRSRLQSLRETLPREDQALLVLRIERELDWKELARVMNEGADLDEETLHRESARLRKRFQAVKERLRELIRADVSA